MIRALPPDPNETTRNRVLLSFPPRPVYTLSINIAQLYRHSFFDQRNPFASSTMRRSVFPCFSFSFSFSPLLPWLDESEKLHDESNFQNHPVRGRCDWTFQLVYSLRSMAPNRAVCSTRIAETDTGGGGKRKKITVIIPWITLGRWLGSPSGKYHSRKDSCAIDKVIRLCASRRNGKVLR